MDLLEIATKKDIPALLQWVKKPTFTEREKELLGERTQEEFVANLKLLFGWLDMQKFAHPFEKAISACEAIEPESGMGNWGKQEILKILKAKRDEIDKELNDLNRLLWALHDFAGKATWEVVDSEVTGQLFVRGQK